MTANSPIRPASHRPQLSGLPGRSGSAFLANWPVRAPGPRLLTDRRVAKVDHGSPGVPLSGVRLRGRYQDRLDRRLLPDWDGGRPGCERPVSLDVLASAVPTDKLEAAGSGVNGPAGSSRRWS
jgi:hypothetical protein